MGRPTGEEVRLDGEFEPAQTYSVQVDPQLRDVQGYTLGEGTGGAPWAGTVALGAEPSLAISGSGIFPAADPPIFGFSSRWVKTLRVRVAALDARQAERVLFQHVKPALRAGQTADDEPATLEELGIPASEIVVRDIPLAVAAPTYWSDLALDLRDLIHADRRGVFWVEALPLELVPPPQGIPAFKSPPRVRALLRRTDLAPISFNSLVRSVLEVIRLSDGGPIPHATVSRIQGGQEVRLGETNAQGRFVWAPPSGVEGLGDTPLVIREAATQDMALLPAWPALASGKPGARDRRATRGEPGAGPGAEDASPLLRRGERMLLSLTPDRDAFRPQESIALCGFALVDSPWAPFGVRTLPAETTARLRVVDGNQKVVAEQSLGLDENGKLWTRLPLVPGASLGGLQVIAEVQGAAVTTHAKLEDFRTPAFEVTAEPARPAILIGESVPFHLAATHYSGVPVVLDKVTYASRCEPWRHGVPGLPFEWQVGAEDLAGHPPKAVRQDVAGARGRVGRVDLTPRLETGGHTSLLCHVEIEVTDASQQPIGTAQALQIHPASFYLAVRPPAGAHVGERAEIRVRALELDGRRRRAPGVRVTITRSWQEVPFTVKALGAGTPQLELRARFSPEHGAAVIEDSVSLPLPIAYEASQREHTAHYGTLDSAVPVALAVRFPAAAVPDVGGVSLSLSTSLLGDLQDAFQYLLDYPYGCLEQTSSRVLALVAARELGQRFGLDGADAARRLGLGIEHMLSMQTASGGFSYWTGEGSVHPYASAFATWVLLLARKAGTAVPAPALDSALDYLARELEPGAGVTGRDRVGAAGPGRASALGTALGASQCAIALDVLAEAGRPLPKAALDEALATRTRLPTFARTLLVSALSKTADPRAASLLEELVSSTSELPATAHVHEIASSAWDDLFHSQHRSDAMALRALLHARPDHPLVPKLVRGLLEARQGGRWGNTQENAYALLAVLEYARRFEAAHPAMVARAWIGNRPWFETALDVTTPSATRVLPLPALPSLAEPAQVVIQRQGVGRVAYRLGTTWQERGDALPARDQGLAISRDVRLRDTPALAPGPGAAGSPVRTILLGETVAFDLTLKTRAPLSYVAIDVPVPAGLEPILDDLGLGHGASRLRGHGNSVLVSHEDRRPDRVLVFIDHLPAGEHRHTIQLRATSPGDFALPPARAEAMYAPEIYGRTSSARLSISGGSP